MSSLNLSPNPTIMAIQAGIFLANFIAVKKLLLEPYLKVRERRIRATLGSQSQAEQLEIENSKSLDQIRRQIQEAGADTNKYRDTALATAKRRRDELLAAASSEASKIVEGMRESLARELATQRQAVPEIVRQLSRQFVDKLVPH